MSLWQFLNQWWNLPYLVMLGLVGVFFALQAVGIATHDGDVDQDVDLDGDGIPDHDVDHDVEDTGLLGVGRVPFMVVWLTFFIFAGFTGLIVNRVLRAASPLSLIPALIAGVLSVRVASKAVRKLVDIGGRGASRRHELAGSIGVVASPALDAHFGEVRVHDPRGNELIVHGHLGEGEAPLRQGDKVVLVELKQDSGLFTVAALKE